jgi:ABC-2 type transport system permease protein
MVILVPALILISWKGLVPLLGGPFALSSCITVGLIAIGLMGYSNSIARDRDKGIFQRLRVAPAPAWSIMASRLTVQLMMIIVMTIALFIIGYQYDKITLSMSGYALGLLAAIVGGAVYLSLGQVIVGLIKNPETVNATTRLVYFSFIMIGMFAGLGEVSGMGVMGKGLINAVNWSPYGTVKHIISDSLQTGAWTTKTSMALLLTLGYTLIFTTLGIKWFRWNTR